MIEGAGEPERFFRCLISKIIGNTAKRKDKQYELDRSKNLYHHRRNRTTDRQSAQPRHSGIYD